MRDVGSREVDPVKDAVEQGCRLGGLVLKNVTEDGLTSVETCLTNVRTWEVVMRGMLYEADLSAAALCRLYEEDAVTALADIRTPSARTMCAATMALALTPRLN